MYGLLDGEGIMYACKPESLLISTPSCVATMVA